MAASGLRFGAELPRPVAPPLAAATGWLNSPPLRPEDLQGRVTLYVFWTYTCINWLRALPYVRAWDAKYRDRGLVVVGVHTPEFAFEGSPGNVRQAVSSTDITFPVALDSDYGVWQAFDNHYWPALYLADGDGVLRYSHFGEGRYEDTERMIQQLLGEAGAPAADGGFVTPIGTGAEAPAAWDDLGSEETYLGYGRTERFASAGGLLAGRPREYERPERLSHNAWALSGTWTALRDRIVAADAETEIAVRFHARDLHLVMTPAPGGDPVRFVVTLDGRPPGDDGGLDVRGDGAGVVTAPRMYQLIRQQHPVTDRTARIHFTDPGAEAFVMTFG